MPYGIVLVLAGLLVGPATVQAQKGDFVRKDLPTAPVRKASEDTPLLYAGGVPAPLTGTLDADDSTYNRQTGICSGASGVGTAVLYDTLSITNTSTGTADFSLTTSAVGNPSSCGIDTFLSAYAPTFTPANSTTNCLTSNEDGGNAALAPCSGITFSVPPGQTAVVVITAFANATQFPYQLNFTGTLPVALQSFSIE